MPNFEWIKKINSVLAEVIKLSESDSSAEKWLDFIASAAKQMDTRPGMNISNLRNLLEPVNQLIKGINAAGPVLPAFMKSASNTQETVNPNNTVNPNPGSSRLSAKPCLNSLAIALLSVFLISFLIRYR